jgi:transposase
MFIKTADKKDKQTGKTYRYYKLCESYRIGSKTRHRTLMVLGKLDDIQTDSEKKMLADRIEELLSGNISMFSDGVPVHIEKLACHYSEIIRKKGFLNQEQEPKDANNQESSKSFEKVDLSSIEMEDVREIGLEWLCKQVLEELGFGDFLAKQGWRSSEITTSLIHLISRASYPASERKTAEWIQDNSGVSELFGIPASRINRFHLYKASKKLYAWKQEIENFLSVRTNELFDLQDKIILFDLTNTYFEGRKATSRLAKFGRSKEKRSDAKLIALALVVNMAGFVKYSNIYRGNIADCKTLEETVDKLATGTSFTGRKPIVVIDAGIATEDNLKMLKEKQYPYVCVSRKKLKDYQFAETETVFLQDKRENPIEVRWLQSQEDTDSYLYIKSQMKAIKESSMNEHFCHRYEEELDNVARGIHKKGCTKKYGKVMERIGRIKERYPAANPHYEIAVEHKDGYAVSVKWKRKAVSQSPAEGVYFIRTSIEQRDEKMVWDIYNTIRQIEESFRVLKTDLSLRPVFHKKDVNTMAHLNLGILAYTLVNTIRYRLKKNQITYDWQNISRIMNTQKAGTISMDSHDGKKIHIRLCSNPTAGAKQIYEAMGYKPMPFYKRKFVFPEN